MDAGGVQREILNTEGALRMKHPDWKPGQSGNPAGRPKGSKDKFTKLKDTFLSALETLGGEKFMVLAAQKDPIGFLRIVGKMLPREIRGDITGQAPLIVKFETVTVEDKGAKTGENEPKPSQNRPTEGEQDAQGRTQ